MKYAHSGSASIPSRKRCKVWHSEKMPARCKLARGHEGECRFGWWHTGVQAINLDLPLPKPLRPIEPEDAALAEPEDAKPRSFVDQNADPSLIRRRR